MVAYGVGVTVHSFTPWAGLENVIRGAMGGRGLGMGAQLKI